MPLNISSVERVWCKVGTTLHKEGISAFERITNELKAIMAEKGYESLEDFRGNCAILIKFNKKSEERRDDASH